MKPALLITIVLILSCTLLLGQAQPSPWLPHVVSAEVAKVLFRESGDVQLERIHGLRGDGSRAENLHFPLGRRFVLEQRSRIAHQVPPASGMSSTCCLPP